MIQYIGSRSIIVRLLRTVPLANKLQPYKIKQRTVYRVNFLRYSPILGEKASSEMYGLSENFKTGRSKLTLNMAVVRAAPRNASNI